MSEKITPQNITKDAQSAYNNGDFLSAARKYEAAMNAYTAMGDSLSAAEMANNCSVAYLQGGIPEAALQVVEGTPEVFEAAGDARRRGMALGNCGAALEALDRLDEAVEAYRQSAEILQQAGETALRLNVMQSLSTLQLRQGRRFEALYTMQNGLDGVKHPTPQQRLLKRLLKIPFQMMNKS